MYYNNLGWLLNKMYPSLEWKIPVKENKIFLTFDDGPVPEITDFVLETLSKYNSKATFFCVGDNIRKNPQTYSRIIENGHLTGNHTFNHLNGWNTPLNEYLKNVEKCQDLLSGSFPDQKKLFRPPYGKITRGQIASLKNDYRIIMWDVLTGDYDKRLSPEKCLRKSIKYAGQGSIVIFHDSIKAEKNMKYVLPRFMEHFLSSGYCFDIL